MFSSVSFRCLIYNLFICFPAAPADNPGHNANTKAGDSTGDDGGGGGAGGSMIIIIAVAAIVVVVVIAIVMALIYRK